MKNTDLIIIGAGPGGYETAIAAAKACKETVLIEVSDVGGTCLNEGCIPTKCLCRSAELLDELRDSERFGVNTGDIGFNLTYAMARKDEVVEQLKSGVNALLKSPYINIVSGEAHFVDAHTVAVGEETFSAPHIIIATGSETKILPIDGADAPGVVTSREMLQLKEIPQRLCIIGGGVIGLEFASIYRSFGSEVTVVEYAKEVLPAFDRDIAKRLRTSLKRRGITFHVGAAVNRIQNTDGVCTVSFDAGGKAGCVMADLVLMAVGRVPRLQGLELDKAGIHYTRRGIEVDEYMQTNVKGVYAIGDVNGLCPLAHAATAQGRVALSQVLGQREAPNLKLVPAAVFTIPEVAVVGLSEEQAAAQNIVCKAHKAFYRANGKSLAMGATDGVVKILVDESGKIIGAHIMGAHAADLIHELAMSMHMGAKLSDISTLIHAHPSLSEIIHDTTMG